MEQANSNKKKRIWPKVLIFAIAEVIVLVGIFAYAYFLKQYNKIQRMNIDVEAVTNKELSKENIKKMQGYKNIAVFGVDARDNTLGAGVNSDVIIIVSIDQDTGNIKMCSVFRDSYLNVGDNKYNKINSAYLMGGPERALRAINQNLDLNITDYITFNWKGVATAINILGGLDIDLTDEEFHYINSYITDTVNGTGIGSVQLEHAGMNHLDGVQAVAYARLRYTDNDFVRTQRQRKVMEMCFEKAKAADLKIKNDLLGNVLSMVATNMTWQDGLDFISKADKYHILDTKGFPFAKGEKRIAGKGDCIVPLTLESNVVRLHQFLFEDEVYDTSTTVEQISARISRETGMYKEGNYNNAYGVGDDYVIPKANFGETEDSTFAATPTKKKKDKKEETSAQDTVPIQENYLEGNANGGVRTGVAEPEAEQVAPTTEETKEDDPRAGAVPTVVPQTKEHR